MVKQAVISGQLSAVNSWSNEGQQQLVNEEQQRNCDSYWQLKVSSISSHQGSGLLIADY